MRITHLKKEAILPTLQTTLAVINGRYGYNVELNRSGSANPRRFTLRVKSSKGPGARRSWKGRRLPCACWHVHRDFLQAFFELEPEAVVSTSLAVYRGRDGSQRDFPQTAGKNAGSLMEPVRIADLCECAE